MLKIFGLIIIHTTGLAAVPDVYTNQTLKIVYSRLRYGLAN